MANHENHENHHHHVVPLAVNLKTFAALVVLTIVTVYTAKNIHLGGSLNLALAMFIASIKATIVFLWFMHLKYDGYLNRVIAITAIIFLLIMYGFSAADIFTR